MFKLIQKYPALLAFGVLTAAFSLPGQTLLVSLFIPHMRETFAMTKTEIAILYSAGTILSALLLPTTGRLLDRLHLAGFTVTAGILLAFGCLTLGLSTGKLTVFLGFFLIRYLGQGALTMISSTTMARIFGPMRGKALGIANLGYPISETVFPAILSLWMIHFGWRIGWIFLALNLIIVFVPAVFWLLRHSPHKKVQIEIEKHVIQAELGLPGAHHAKHWEINDVLKDIRFYLVLFSILIPGIFFTGLFFHQASFFEWKQWDLSMISLGYCVFGATRAFFSVASGPMVDRYSARKIFPINLLPLALGLLLLVWGREPYYGLFYLALAGTTMGLSITISGALYAEFYGTKALGTIRGLISSVIIFFTAFAPVGIGYVLDRGIALEKMLLGMTGFILFATILSYLGCVLEAKPAHSKLPGT